MLAGKGSSRPDWLDVLSNQAFHLHFCHAVMYAQEVSAYLECLRKVCLVFVFGVVLFYLHIGDDCRTEVIKNGPSPYFLDNILVFLGVKGLETQGILEIPERIFQILYESSYKMKKLFSNVASNF